jgi:hypothetical protein
MRDGRSGDGGGDFRGHVYRVSYRVLGDNICMGIGRLNQFSYGVG